MLSGKRILFYVPGIDVIKGAVYYSQVFGLAQYLVRQGAQCLVVESAYDENQYWEKVLDGVELVNCPLLKKYVPQPFLPLKNRKITKPAWKRMVDFCPTHIYVRNVYAGIAALKIAKVVKAKLIFSRRGHEVAESIVEGSLREWIKSRVMRLYTTFLMRRVAHVNMVAQTLYNDTSHFCRTTSVLPCCVMDEKFQTISDDERIECRKSLNIPTDAKVVIYSGSMAHYQIPEVFLSMMKQLHDMDGSLVFVILTEMLDVFTRYAHLVGLPQDCYRALKCRPQEVSRYLQSADVGVILRKDDEINHYASPVKIAEYLASGLGLIVSPWIGDIGKELVGKDFVFLKGRDSPIRDIVSFIRSLTPLQRQHARIFARSYYTYEGNEIAVESMFS